ncbi:ethionine resistance protein [Coemansia sp. RSA 1722]|nr:ethionine resistance protein [Coemansia sp. RSA 1722]
MAVKTPTPTPTSTSTTNHGLILDQERSEYSPLLTSRNTSQSTLLESSNAANIANVQLDNETDIGYMDMIKQETMWLVPAIVPMSFTYLCLSSFNFVSLLAVGRLGVTELAGVSLGIMLANFLVLMPGFGFSATLDSFCYSAFTACEDKTQVGFHARRGIVAITTLVVPIAVLFIFIDPLLVMTGQSPEVAYECGRFLRIWMLGSWPQLVFDCLRRFVNAQGNVKPGTYIMFIALPIHVANSYFLVWSPTVGMGVVGAPIATAITHWSMLVMMTVYICFSKARFAWGSTSLDCIDGISEFYHYAIPSALMMASSWAAYEVVTFGASLFGPVALSAQACIFNLMCLTYQVPAACGASAAIRIGHSLGEGKQRRARYSSAISISMGYVFGIGCSTLLFIYRHQIGYLYCDDIDVVEMCSALIPYFASVQTYDGLNGLVDSLMRSLGKQDLSVYMSIPAFWCLGVPLGYYLALGPMQMETVGLWIGLSLGVVVYSITQQVFVLFYIDWRHEVKVCLERLAKAAPVQNPIDNANSLSAATLNGYGSSSPA